MSYRHEEEAPVPFTPEQVAWIRGEIAKATARAAKVELVTHNQEGVAIQRDGLVRG